MPTQRKQENYGVLILSEFTGTAGSLSSAILVNPFDYVGVANGIKEALELSREEKAIKHHVCLTFFEFHDFGVVS